MSMTSKERILGCAVELLKAAPQGIRYSDLVSQIHSKLPEIPKNTIHGNVWNLEANLPRDVCKPAKGLFLHATFHKTAPQQNGGVEAPGIEKITEQQFYAPFRDWLIHELEECTKAIAVGGNKFKDPQFDIRVRAAKQEPDMFYVNRYMKFIEDELFS